MLWSVLLRSTCEALPMVRFRFCSYRCGKRVPCAGVESRSSGGCGDALLIRTQGDLAVMWTLMFLQGTKNVPHMKKSRGCKSGPRCICLVGLWSRSAASLLVTHCTFCTRRSCATRNSAHNALMHTFVPSTSLCQIDASLCLACAEFSCAFCFGWDLV